MIESLLIHDSHSTTANSQAHSSKSIFVLYRRSLIPIYDNNVLHYRLFIFNQWDSLGSSSFILFLRHVLFYYIVLQHKLVNFKNNFDFSKLRIKKVVRTPTALEVKNTRRQKVTHKTRIFIEDLIYFLQFEKFIYAKFSV